MEMEMNYKSKTTIPIHTQKHRNIMQNIVNHSKTTQNVWFVFFSVLLVMITTRRLWFEA